MLKHSNSNGINIFSSVLIIYSSIILKNLAVTISSGKLQGIRVTNGLFRVKWSSASNLTVSDFHAN